MWHGWLSHMPVCLFLQYKQVILNMHDAFESTQAYLQCQAHWDHLSICLLIQWQVQSPLLFFQKQSWVLYVPQIEHRVVFVHLYWPWGCEIQFKMNTFAWLLSSITMVSIVKTMTTACAKRLLARIHQILQISFFNPKCIPSFTFKSVYHFFCVFICDMSHKTNTKKNSRTGN